MKRERLVVLLGLLVATIFFYLGLNAWLKNKEEKVIPPPVVIQPKPKEATPQTQTAQPPTPPAEKTPTSEEKPHEEKKEREAQKVKEEPIAQKIKEEKKIVKKEEHKKKTYTVQIGAFSNAENARKALKKAEKLGYKGSIVQEGGLYKVRLKVATADIKKDVSKLKSHFGSVILKR